MGNIERILGEKDNVSLKKISGTCCSVLDDACQSLYRDWNKVFETLTIISNDVNEKPNTRCTASGDLQQIQRLETVILSILWGIYIQPDKSKTTANIRWPFYCRKSLRIINRICYKYSKWVWNVWKWSPWEGRNCRVRRPDQKEMKAYSRRNQR